MKSALAALLMVFGLCGVALAQEAEGEGGDSHAVQEIQKQPWTFAGLFGTYDQNQLQRGFQVFREVCAGCHGARLLAFRNLHEFGGPEYSEEQVKALAAEYQIADLEAEGGVRPGVPADRWPSPFATEQDARDVFGVVPPDLSVMAKARGTTQPFPWWITNYFTAYSEGGPDYIHAMLTGYHEEAPEGFELPEGKYYNEVYPGHAIAMPPVLQEGGIVYEAEGVPQSPDQYARDVSAFLMWVAEPHLVSRKETGFRVLLFLILFAVAMYMVKDRLWRPIHHHNPAPGDVPAARAHETPPPH